MAELTEEERRAGLEFAKALALFAASAPHHFAEHKVHQTVGDLQKHYGYSRSLKKIYILRYIAKAEGGLLSKSEITAHFRWHRDVVSEIVDELLAESKIERRVPAAAGSGSNGGRKATRYCIAKA